LDFHDFRGVHFAQRTAFHREVLCEDIHQTAVHGAVTGDYAFTRQFFFLLPEVRAAVRYELVEFHEGTRVQQQGDPLAGGFLAARMLFFYPFFAAARQHFFALTVQ